MRTIYGPIYTLRPYERGIQEKLGKYHSPVSVSNENGKSAKISLHG